MNKAELITGIGATVPAASVIVACAFANAGELIEATETVLRIKPGWQLMVQWRAAEAGDVLGNPEELAELVQSFTAAQTAGNSLSWHATATDHALSAYTAATDHALSARAAVLALVSVLVLDAANVYDVHFSTFQTSIGGRLTRPHTSADDATCPALWRLVTRACDPTGLDADSPCGWFAPRPPHVHAWGTERIPLAEMPPHVHSQWPPYLLKDISQLVASWRTSEEIIEVER